MLLHRNSPSDTYVRILQSLLLAVMLCPVGSILAEPLGYVTRPARADLGVFDPKSKSMWGAISLPAPPTVVAVNTDGTTAYVGLEYGPPVWIDTLNATVADFPKTDQISGIRAIAFNPVTSLAYLTTDRAELVVVGTQDHTIVDSLPLPTPLDDLSISADGEWLVGRDTRSSYPVITIIHLPTLEQIEFSLASQQELTDLQTGRDGLFYVLGKRFITRFGLELTSSARGSELRMTHYKDLDLGELLQNSPVSAEEIARVALPSAAQKIYLGHDDGVIVINCARRSLPDNTEPYSCFDILDLSNQTQVVVLTPIDMSSIGSGRGVESLQDMQLLPDESELYVIGRRAVAGVETESDTLNGDFRMVSGGEYLGNVAFGGPVATCIARSTSIAALRLEIKSLDAGNQTIKLLLAKIDKARNDLRNENITSARYALDTLIGRAVWRSSLAQDDPEQLSSENAASIICAAGNLISRLDPYATQPK